MASSRFPRSYGQGPRLRRLGTSQTSRALCYSRRLARQHPEPEGSDARLGRERSQHDGGIRGRWRDSTPHCPRYWQRSRNVPTYSISSSCRDAIFEGPSFGQFLSPVSIGWVGFASPISGRRATSLLAMPRAGLLVRNPRMVREIDHVLSRFWESGLNVFYVDPPVVREDGTCDSQIERTRSAERSAHRRLRRRKPTALLKRLSTTIRSDFERRLAFRRLLRSDHTNFAAVSGSSALSDAVPSAGTQAATDRRMGRLDDDS